MNGEFSQAAEAGYFGKMPVRGDFLSRDLPREFVEPWDDWVQLALQNSREQLSDKWLDFYLTSPVWRFVLAPGICGKTAWLGVLMPSVDSVGRYFPLTVASPLPQGTDIFGVLDSSQTWLNQVEELARSCLEEGFDLSLFEKEIKTLNHPPGENQHNGLDGIDAGNNRLLNAWRYAMSSPSLLTSNCTNLLQELLKRLLYTYSLWWTVGSVHVSPTFLLCQGLPPPEGYSAMLDGEWQQWGWEDTQVFEQ
jgi:type VI secretion system protein ImpM